MPDRAHRGAKRVRSTDPGGIRLRRHRRHRRHQACPLRFRLPHRPADNLWVPAREDPTRLTIIPIGDIHIFIGETDLTPATETNFRRIGMAE
jgi:hypothetical protein